MAAIKKQLKQRRIELHMTLEQVANAVGTTKQTIQKYESGVITNIPPERVEALAKALKATPAKLMGWDEQLYDQMIQNNMGDILYKNNNNDYAITLPVSSVDLTDEEEQLLICYRELNKDGQARIVEYAEDLVASGRYIKSDYVSEEA